MKPGLKPRLKLAGPLFALAMAFAMAFAMAAMTGCDDAVDLPDPATPPVIPLVPEEDPGDTPATALTIRLPDDADDLLDIGETLRLTAVFEPAEVTNDHVGWVSSNTTVATVSADGVVTGVDGGAVTIYAYAKAVPSVRATRALTVVTHVESVTLGANAVSVFVNGSAALTASVAPSNATNQAVTWTSSDTAVATVTGSGTSAAVKGISPGTATITVTTDDGEHTANAAVTVKALPEASAEHTLVVRNLAATPSGDTTADSANLLTFTGQWTAPDGEPLVVKNTVSNAVMGDKSGMPSNATLVYVATPIAGPYTFSVKATTISGSGDGGFFFGVFGGPAPEETPADGYFYMAGIRHTGGGAFRVFYSPGGSEPTNGLRADKFASPEPSGTGAEHTYRISWDGSAYTVTVIDEDGTEHVNSAWAGSGGINALLTNPDAAYYPGFFVARNAATITEISLVTE